MLRVLLSIGLYITLVPSLMAQTAGTGALTGTVTDSSGAVVPGVTVNARHMTYPAKTERPLTGEPPAKSALALSGVLPKANLPMRLAAGASNGQVNRELSALKRAFSLGVQAGKVAMKPDGKAAMKMNRNPAANGTNEWADRATADVA